jgi:beta-lactamase regulating signal transducer with metallopeptidase domain
VSTATVVSTSQTLGATLYRGSLLTWESDAMGRLAPALMLVWIAGAVILTGALSYRQRRFVRSLEPLRRDADGKYRSGSIQAPLVMGVWRPRLVVPVDFEARFEAPERALVLAHERAHLMRADVGARALGMVALCLFWFNPLVYWALGRLRFDQELACDAVALARCGSSRRRYAEALLKTQLMVEGAWPLPVFCSWHSAHPIKTRVALLARPLPGRVRLLAGVAVALSVSGLGSFAVWAAQPQTHAQGAPIAIHLEWSVEEAVQTQLVQKRRLVHDMVVHSGKAFRVFTPGQPYSTLCTAFLHGEGASTEVLEKIRKDGAKLEGMVLASCQMRSHGADYPTMSLLMRDSAGLAKEDAVSMEVGFGEPKVLFRLTLIASTAPDRLKATRE